jgi:hypothetical protein
MAFISSETGRIIYDSITKAEVVQANYPASFKDDSKVDDAIIMWTGWMPWNWGTIDASHTSLGFWLDGELWFSSATSRSELGTNKENGTRWIKATELLRHPERWHLQVKSFKRAFSGQVGGKIKANIENKLDRANAFMGKRYDFKGVLLDFTVPWRVLRKKWATITLIKKIKKIYCSKFVHAVDTGWLTVMSPKRRYKWASKNGYEYVGCMTKTWLKRNGVIS